MTGTGALGVAHLVHADLAGSSRFDLRAEERSGLSRALEDWFRYCMQRLAEAGDASTVEIQWAGDGGFALVAEARDVAKDVLSATHDFVQLAPLMVRIPRAGESGQRGNAIRPILRVLVARLEVAQTGRLSNAASRELNGYLKYERELTEADTVTVTAGFMARLRDPGNEDAVSLELHSERVTLRKINRPAILSTESASETLWRLRPRIHYAHGVFTNRRERLLEAENERVHAQLEKLGSQHLERRSRGIHPYEEALQPWVNNVLVNLGLTWRESLVGGDNFRVRYFRLTGGDGQDYGLAANQVGSGPAWLSGDRQRLGAAGGGRSAWRAAVDTRLPVVVADVTREAALWDPSVTKTTGILAHVSYPIVVEGDLVCGVICADFLCRALNTDYTCTASDAEHVERVWLKSQHDPVFRQLEVFAQELRYGELASRLAWLARPGERVSPRAPVMGDAREGEQTRRRVRPSPSGPKSTGKPRGRKR